ncbi:hypothetical protein P168DRAFT_154392 [Aspergillus campestris IBT 28561]|uniref:F-box domain-containing protein n=1 Tax=Aspergillus campestris (strain IBT 28561) TaxID=1392248 RepID=A0A2I1D2Y1_ASPC2|nr:uncharacterized protein P168DRAFT_154392 [Aspergillus campestris IBT 28561]PKY04230.1 hypothetical protein P168DRAFT_154392 [Aspergillus campestris IBT 28561]
MRTGNYPNAGYRFAMARLDHLVHAFSPSRRRQRQQGTGQDKQQDKQQDQQQDQQQEERQEEASAPFPLNRVPQDIVYEIAKWLPIASRLCLALTCKGFLTAIDYSRALRRSHTIRLNETNLNPYLTDSVGYFTSERAQFMSLLHEGMGNDHPRWRCCFDCLMLHHPRAFPALFHWGKYHEPFHHHEKPEFFHRNGKHDPPRRRRPRGSLVKSSNNYCGKGVVSHGYVIVCPCLRLTVRDVEIISREVRRDDPPIPRSIHYLFKRRTVEIPIHTCRHQYTDVDVDVDISVSASFADTGDPGSLTLRTTYTLSGTKILESAEQLPLQLCPHISIPRYLNHKYGFHDDIAPLHHGRSTLPCTTCTFTCARCRLSATYPEILSFSDPKDPHRITEHINFQTVRLMILDNSFPKPLYAPRLLFPRRLLGRADTFVGEPHYTLSQDYPAPPSQDKAGQLLYSKNHLW